MDEVRERYPHVDARVADVQERLQSRISELDFEVHEDEFTYWTSARHLAGKR